MRSVGWVLTALLMATCFVTAYYSLNNQEALSLIAVVVGYSAISIIELYAIGARVASRPTRWPHVVDLKTFMIGFLLSVAGIVLLVSIGAFILGFVATWVGWWLIERSLKRVTATQSPKL